MLHDEAAANTQDEEGAAGAGLRLKQSIGLRHVELVQVLTYSLRSAWAASASLKWP